MTRTVSTIALAIMWTLLAPAQDTMTPPTPGSSYLLRMERTLLTEDSCVLLRGDGQFHFERETTEGTEVFEGTISQADLQEIENLVNREEIVGLSQDKLSSPLVGIPDQLILSVARLGHWQDLRFLTPSARLPFQRSLDPLLKWMGNLHRQKHVKLTEYSGKNNCLPPGPIELRARPTSRANSPRKSLSGPPKGPSTAPSGPDRALEAVRPFTMRMATTQIKDRQTEKTCTVVYADGRYHRERRTQKTGKSDVKTQVFEETLSPAALQELSEILDDPKLTQRQHQKPPASTLVEEMEYIGLTISRGDHAQELNFWRYLMALRSGPAGMPVVDENGMKLLKPLNNWMKANLQGSALDHGESDNCGAPSS